MSTALASEGRKKPRQALVLNADHTVLSTWPLSLIDSRDALHAWYREKVTVLDNWPGEFFHSPSITVPVPKVIALNEYRSVYAEPKFCRRSVILRDRFSCQYCGERFQSHELTFDHLIPRAKGGTTCWTNILSACMDCNALKRDQDANLSGRKGHKSADGRLRPLKLPRRPTAMELLKAGLEFLPADLKEDFASWLYWNVQIES